MFTNLEILFMQTASGTMGATCGVFLALCCFAFALSALTTNFVLRRSQGIYLIVLYFMFFLFAILSEFEVIHPYGTQHSMDNKPYIE